ncbi:MAG: sensor histidine kinase [Oliverpabstia sp.]
MIKNVIIILLIVILIAQFLITRMRKREVEKQIEDLISYLMRVQDRLDLPEMEHFREGQLSILQSEIYKVVVLLREAYSEELSQKRYMSDMLSDISHQIKTPISAITIMTDLLEEPELSDEQRLDYADKIDKQAKRITWLIRNLLTLAQLQADVLELKKEPVYVRDILRDIQDSLEIMAEIKGIQLICQSDAAVCISCDKHWMTEALLNIVKNSVEHTNEGGTVKVQVAQDAIATHIHVVDDGEGIDSAHLPHIFERFYKTDNASANSVGIGLAMAKQIILKQNGTITAASEKGVGTDFYIKLFRTDTV